MHSAWARWNMPACGGVVEDVFSVAGCGFGEPLRRRRRWRMTERMVRRATRARVPAVVPRTALGERLWEGGGGGVREVESGGEGEGEGGGDRL